MIANTLVVSIVNPFPLPFNLIYGFYIIAALLLIIFFLLGFILGNRAKPTYLLSGEKQKKLADRIKRREAKHTPVNPPPASADGTSPPARQVDRTDFNKTDYNRTGYNRNDYNRSDDTRRNSANGSANQPASQAGNSPYNPYQRYADNDYNNRYYDDRY